ncbi:hypothetical protein E4U41_006684, partial [Claviceps citrina]
MPRTSTRNRPAVNYKEGSDGMTRQRTNTANTTTTTTTTTTTKKTPRKKTSDTDPKDNIVSTPAAPAEAAAAAAAAAPRKGNKEEPTAVNDGKRKTEDAAEAQRPKKKRTARADARAKKGQDDTMAPLADRTAVSCLKKAMYVGAHVSAAGGVHNAVTNALQIGANSFALFLKSQRKWDSPPMSTEAQDQFLSSCKAHGYSAAEHALPHGSYLVNLAQADGAKAAQALASFVDDLQRCEALGIRL